MVFAFENTPTTTSDLKRYIQDRTIATALPALRPGVGAGAIIVGNVVAGVVVSAMLQAGESEITRLTVKDKAASDKIRAARAAKLANAHAEPSTVTK